MQLPQWMLRLWLGVIFQDLIRDLNLSQNSLNFICLSDSNFCLHGFCFSGDLNTNVDFSNFILVKI
jgi:hypothetical protein